MICIFKKETRSRPDLKNKIQSPAPRDVCVDKIQSPAARNFCEDNLASVSAQRNPCLTLKNQALHARQRNSSQWNQRIVASIDKKVRYTRVSAGSFRWLMLLVDFAGSFCWFISLGRANMSSPRRPEEILTLACRCVSRTQGKRSSEPRLVSFGKH